jgi:hypothetical protein
VTKNYKGYLIEITNVDVGYEDETQFDAIYGNDEYQSNSHHAIYVREDDKTVASALLKGSAGATGVYDNSFVLIDDNLVTRCSNRVYAFVLPHLQLKWSKELDFATCLQLFEFEGDVVVHGECEITRITTNGDISWQFSAKDIFVNMNGHRAFEIIGKQIKLVDFQDYEYILDTNGKLVSERLL